MFRNIFEPPGDVDAIFRQHAAEELVFVTAPDHPAALDWQIPGMADIAVVVGRTMRILARFANEGRRRNYRLVAGGARGFIVEVERIIVSDCEGEIAN
jgi:hypothetical protein